MNDIESKILLLSKKFENDRGALLQEIFLLIKNSIIYKFGDWTLDPNMVFNKKEGMCTTKSRCLFEILSSLGFQVYYRVLRINARMVFGRFTIEELKNFLSNNSVHFYIIVKLNNKFISLDPSLDEKLENRLTYFNYVYDKNWNVNKDYINFIDEKFIISKSELLNNIDIFINKKIKLANKFKFFISNIFLDYLRTCDIEEIKCGQIKKNYFLKWLKSKNYLKYLVIRILIIKSHE